ncbi:MAG TPA: Flp pilus assembly protein CpaB [Allosphingosinicella sp.]|nr:Flp pilus assembly protein CpaB [Allosphingosinicella sp.]
MDVKKIMLLVGALVIAAVTAVMAKNMFTGAGAPRAEAAAVAGPEVLVATRALPVGTIIDAETFRYQAWPEGLVQGAYYVKGAEGTNPQDLIGTVVRNEITAGQPITRGALIKPGERGFLAAALGPGMRAVTVAVTNTSSVAGFVFPGDRVDMVLTQDVPGDGGGLPLKVSETILRNVRVLATNQNTHAKDADGKPILTELTMVTVEVTPKIAEKITVAQTIGKLSLTLRALANNNAELEQAIASGEVSVPEGSDPKAERNMLLAAASRPVDAGATATVGSEVSRYQRSTVPVKSRSEGKPDPARMSGAMGDMINAMANRITGKSGDAPAAPARPVGPVVRIARGNSVTEVPVGAR